MRTKRFINWKPVTRCVDRRNNEGGNSFAKWHMEKEMKSWRSGPKSSGRGFVINGYFAWRIVDRSRDRQVDTDVHCSDGQLPVQHTGERNESTYTHAGSNYAQKSVLRLREKERARR